ncbi:MAG: histidine kinase N-terminal 7TM domain-containing protein, partial [Anaerolineae bacterium]|nr:histidine kinase N-terminal 7TM domain-containing protein [Anaerolineae bacterium]
MPWTFTPYVLPLLLSAIVSAALAASAWRRRTAAPCAIPLSLMAFGAAEYALGYALELLAPDLQGKIFWAKIEYLGIASLAPCFLAFALEYAGFARHLSRRTVALLAAAVATTVLLAATNEAHGLIWTSTTLGREGSTSVLILARGPAFWAFAAWSYALLLMGGGLLLNAALHGVGLYRRQSLALLGGLLLPLLANAGYALGISPLPHLNPTPLVFTLSVVLFGLAIFRFRLLDLVPVARRALVEEMHEGVLVVDALGRVMDLNPAMGRMIGRPSTEVIGKPVEEALGDWPELAAHIREARPLEAEVSRGEDKARSEYALSVSLLLGQPGWPPGRLIVLRDITEMKRLEAQYLQAQKMELIGQLARGVAHDFNNALTAIQGYASLAGDHLPPTSPAREYLGRLLANADRAARLSQQLLAFSRRQPASPRQLILNDLIGDIHALLPRATAAEVCLETRPAPGLWPVHADPGQMEQVLLNLL